MSKRQPAQKTKPRRKPRRPGSTARTPLCAHLARTSGTVLRSYTVGPLPIVDQILDQVGLEQFLREYLPKEDGRTKLPTTKALLVLLRNVLVSREPIYGVGEWAARQAPDLLGLAPQEIEPLNDDRIGRALDRLFLADVRQVKTRLVIDDQIDLARVTEAGTGDGVFPLVTNVMELSPRELLFSYKRQPTIEKRFSQLKTDFAVAPVYLKEVRRIQALLCVYFFALLVEALLERELRRAMQREQIESLPMYPEGRPCCWPTARRLIDLFEPVQRHTLIRSRRPTEVMVTELTLLQRKLLKLLNLSSNNYGR